ncbi:uncharacterized protein LOC132047521 [Lycium ferocissimum]|uniref:uncharacterized protein LOC132047521 n=1 Tax=Lycium ferocissimum TaxID=112874 RepID=UPI0028151075|nr:uncharacterized protein LOC132047521 [Lycium ferocissimum]
MRRVIAIDGTHLYGRYEGVLFSAVAQDTENHIYPIAFCVADKECDESWTYFFEQLRYIIDDEPDLCIISDRHKSIANDVSRIFEHAHHGLCMKHLAKAYGYQEVNEHFQELRNKCPEAANCLEFDIGFDKWSRAYFPSVNRYDAETYRYQQFNQLFVPSAEKMLREKMNDGDYLFVNNINGDADEFIVVSSGLAAKVNLLNKTCTCREYDLVKLLCAHAMVALRLKYGPDYCSSIYEYSSPMYKFQSYILAFGETINVVPAESEWEVPEKYANMYIPPPLYEPKLGRKRVKRIPGIAESFKSRGSSKGTRNKCSICKGAGHKKTTCRYLREHPT